jgi:methylmalonyl-CoA/ethylmalonyl-CoA epimerase
MSQATPFGRIDQVGIVVRHLDAAVERYDGALGGGPWRGWTYGPGVLAEQQYRGDASRFEMRIALSSGTPQIELIEPVSGPSIYHDWLERHGEGLHHLGSWVADLDAGVERMQRHGFAVIQLGRGHGLDGDGGFAYFDTRSTLGAILELIEVPARRLEPERVWGRVAA